MKTVVIYASRHRGNTKRIAEALASGLSCEALSWDAIEKYVVAKCDLIGFGSGVYFGKFHQGLNEFLQGLPEVRKKRAFLFSTSGLPKNPVCNRAHEDFKKKLHRKNFIVEAEFDCRGHDSFGIFKLIGGINRGRPNEKDIQRAREFAAGLRGE